MKKRHLSKVKKLLAQNKEGVVKLNLGCGTDYKNGWINIDNNSDNNIEKLDLSWDLRNPLPFDDKTVDFIFNEHFFEHLTVEEGQVCMKDFMRVLKDGGVLRIAMPDLEEAVGLYNDPNWQKRPFVKKFGLDFAKTNAELLNMNFSWWGHKWLYNWEELDRRLKQANCNNIKRCKRGISNSKQLRNLETRDESNLIAEITK